MLRSLSRSNRQLSGILIDAIRSVRWLEFGISSPESHQRSWWIVHTQPTRDGNARLPESHQRSWWIVHTQPTLDRNARLPESHQRSWWIVHTQPTRDGNARLPES